MKKEISDKINNEIKNNELKFKNKYANIIKKKGSNFIIK